MATRRIRRQAARGRDEMLGMLVSCIGGAAILAFLSPRLLQGIYGVALGGIALSAIILAVFFHLRQGGSMAGALALVLLTGGLTAAGMYGIWWCFFVYVAAQPNLFNVGALAAPPTPSRVAAATDPRHVETSASPAAEVVIPPAAVPSSCGTAVVHDVKGLVLRAEPAKSGAQLQVVTRDEAVTLLCTPTVIADQIEWQHVRRGNVEGWMSQRFLRVIQP